MMRTRSESPNRTPYSPRPRWAAEPPVTERMADFCTARGGTLFGPLDRRRMLEGERRQLNTQRVESASAVNHGERKHGVAME